MTTDLLRRASAKIRDTANDAARGPWTADTVYQPEDGIVWVLGPDSDPVGAAHIWSAGCVDHTGMSHQTAAHLALWHPGVALAVADLLDRWVWMTERYPREGFPGSTLPEALAIARTILGEDN